MSSDPEAERERAGARAASGCRRRRRRRRRAGRIAPDGEHGPAEAAQIRIEVERQRGVAGQPALVAREHDPRLDPDARRPAGDDDAEVRRRRARASRGRRARGRRARRRSRGRPGSRGSGSASPCASRPSSSPCRRRRGGAARVFAPASAGAPVRNQYGMRRRSAPRGAARRSRSARRRVTGVAVVTVTVSGPGTVTVGGTAIVTPADVGLRRERRRPLPGAAAGVGERRPAGSPSRRARRARTRARPARRRRAGCRRAARLTTPPPPREVGELASPARRRRRRRRRSARART